MNIMIFGAYKWTAFLDIVYNGHQLIVNSLLFVVYNVSRYQLCYLVEYIVNIVWSIRSKKKKIMLWIYQNSLIYFWESVYSGLVNTWLYSLYNEKILIKTIVFYIEIPSSLYVRCQHLFSYKYVLRGHLILSIVPFHLNCVIVYFSFNENFKYWLVIHCLVKTSYLYTSLNM